MGLYEFMVREELQLRLKKQEEEFQAAGELALAKEYAQVYRILIQLFEKFVELLGDEPVALEEYWPAPGRRAGGSPGGRDPSRAWIRWWRATWNGPA